MEYDKNSNIFLSMCFQEHERLYECSTLVSQKTFERPEHHVPLWVTVVVNIIKKYFWSVLVSLSHICHDRVTGRCTSGAGVMFKLIPLKPLASESLRDMFDAKIVCLSVTHTSELLVFRILSSFYVFFLTKNTYGIIFIIIKIF